MNHVLAALAEMDRTTQRRIEVRREAADEFHLQVRQALAGTVWTGCDNWYLDANGHSPNQWPWTWGTYTRRTRRLERGAYRLGAGR
jgi:hypothetical protein